MKRFIIALTAFLTLTLSASAMSYEQARERALFLTDKMAYELNLTDEQYEAAYEINLDYLMSISSYDDLYGIYWRQRNLDLSYILLDWQYSAYVAASYFYRPLYWDGGFWHFGIYARYPHRDYYYFGCPTFVYVYHGEHGWRHNGGRSWYYGRTWSGPRPEGRGRIGMRDGFERGDYGYGSRTFGGRGLNNMRSVSAPASQSRSFGGRSNNGISTRSSSQSRSFGGRNNSSLTRSRSSVEFGGRGINQSTRSRSSVGSSRRNFGNMPSSTRTTVRRGFNSDNNTFGGRSNSKSMNTPSRTFTPRSSSSSSRSSQSRSFSAPSTRSGSMSGRSSSRSFGGSSFGSSRSSGSSFGGSRSSGTRSSGSFGGSHSSGGMHTGRR